MIGGEKAVGLSEFAMLWTLNLSDGKNSLLDIAERSGISYRAIKSAAEALRDHDLLQVASFRAGSTGEPDCENLLAGNTWAGRAIK
jgi:hypothetical protein